VEIRLDSSSKNPSYIAQFYRSFGVFGVLPPASDGGIIGQDLADYEVSGPVLEGLV
jgi:hypothetical protein